jgi:F-type H+-transporting ATPase subunit delta
MRSSQFSYAKAIYQLCSDENDQKVWIIFLKNIITINSDKVFKRWYYDPIIPFDKKQRVLLKFFENTSIEHKNFLKKVLKNKKLELIPDILKALDIIFFEKNSYLQALIKTSYFLSEKELEPIDSFLSKKFQKKIRFVQIIEPIVGLEIEIGNNRIYYTTNFLLDRITILLKQGSTHDA